MRVLLVVAALLWPASAFSQAFPVGSGLVEFKERIKVSGGCDSFNGVGTMLFSVNPDGTWVADTPTGLYSGVVEAADTKGLKWDLFFDEDSLWAYLEYLEDAASVLCGTPAILQGGEIRKFEASFRKDLRSVQIRLQTQAVGSTAFGSGKGKHAIQAKGGYAPAQ